MKTAQVTPDLLDSNIDRLYDLRLPKELLARRAAVWKILCKQWLGRYIEPESKVLEVAAGYCEFINNIQASERVIVDINPETRRHAAPDVVVHGITAERLAEVLPHAYFDAVFMSNFLEHCSTRDVMLSVLKQTVTVLKPGGRLLILGPNFHYCYKEYFDLIDHHLPLTEKSVVEALQLVGLKIKLVKPRTLPFTFKSRLPSWPWLVHLYIRLPFLWSFFGAQFFIIGQKA